MKKTSVLAILAAGVFAASPLYAQDTSSQPSSEPSSQVSSELSSQPSSRPSSEPSSEPSQPSSEPSSQPSSESSSEPGSQASSEPSSENGGTEVGFSLDIDLSFSFKLTLPQAIEFRDIVVETGSAPVQVDSSVDVSVGASVPSTIVLTPLPARIIALYPELDGFLFFLLPDGRIVVVHPQTLKIVLILIVD